jgi:hypothetical protein
VNKLQRYDYNGAKLNNGRSSALVYRVWQNLELQIPGTYKIRGQLLIPQYALLLTQNRETYLCKGKVSFHNAGNFKNIYSIQSKQRLHCKQ